jgi:signal transduction histidine kinase
VLAAFLGVIALVVALGARPVVRRLTGRLERLQRGVESLGAGDLRARVKVEGRDEVARLAESFNQAAARIESLVDAHKMLLANASHELRTPLTRIRLGLELAGAPSERKAELERDIAELDQLVDEILLVSCLTRPIGSTFARISTSPRSRPRSARATTTAASREGRSWSAATRRCCGG